MKNDLIDGLVAAGAVCVAYRDADRINVIVYGTGMPDERIRTYRRGAVDGRWDGPLCETAQEVMQHMANSKAPCVLPVGLAHQLFGWDNFASMVG